MFHSIRVLLCVCIAAAACSSGCKECKCPNDPHEAGENLQAFQSENIGHLLDVVATDASGRLTPKDSWHGIHSADIANKPDGSRPLNAWTISNASLVRRIPCSGSRSITSRCAGSVTDERQFQKLGADHGTTRAETESEERNCTRADAIATGLDAGECTSGAALESVRSSSEQAGTVGITGCRRLQSALRSYRRVPDSAGPTGGRRTGCDSWRIIQPTTEPAGVHRPAADQSHPGTAHRIRYDSHRTNSPDWFNVSSTGRCCWAGSTGRTREENERWRTASC